MTASPPARQEEETERNYKSTIGKVRGRQDFNEPSQKRMLLSYNIIKGGRVAGSCAINQQPSRVFLIPYLICTFLQSERAVDLHIIVDKVDKDCD